MKASVDIAGQEMIVEYDFDITVHGSSESGPSFYSGGEPAEAAEFEITVHGIDFVTRDADVPQPEMPDWLKDILATHLSERDDINDIVQQADMERF